MRVENLMLVVAGPEVPDSEKPLHAFETLTLAPIDRRLILREMLDADEIAWLDAYHARVCEELAPLCDAPTREWLVSATRPI
jgi:Xaa-Pro aminopeptidase